MLSTFNTWRRKFMPASQRVRVVVPADSNVVQVRRMSTSVWYLNSFYTRSWLSVSHFCRLGQSNSSRIGLPFDFAFDHASPTLHNSACFRSPFTSCITKCCTRRSFAGNSHNWCGSVAESTSWECDMQPPWVEIYAEQRVGYINHQFLTHRCVRSCYPRHWSLLPLVELMFSTVASNDDETVHIRDYQNKHYASCQNIMHV